MIPKWYDIGNLQSSLTGTVTSLSSRALEMTDGLVFHGLRPVSCWIMDRLMPVVEDLSLAASLATSAPSELLLFSNERKKLTYLANSVVRMD